MADRRIDQLTALATVDSADLFAVYDVSAADTKKSTLPQVKTSLLAGGLSTDGEVTAFAGTAKEINLGEHLIDLTGTSLETGGVIQATVGVSTTYSITDGSGIHVDHVNDEFMSCVWTGLTGITPGGAGNRTRYIFLEDPDNDGVCTVYESGTLPTPEDRRNRIFLGRVVVNSSNVIIAVVSYPVIDQAITNQLYDLAASIGIINIEGNALSANGANLSINKSAGTLFVAGANYSTNPNDPHRVAMASASPVTFQHMTQTAATGTNVTVISPGNYDVGGTITAIGGSNNQATNMRVYLFPSGNVRIAYGQTVYSTLTAAEAGIATESFVINPQVTGNGTLIGVLSVTKGCTALNNTSTANFSPVSKFGEALAGATGGASTTTLQQAYDNSSANPEILTDSTRGGLAIRRGSAADTDTVLEIQNNAGSVTASVTGAGVLNANTITMTNANITGLTAETAVVMADEVMIRDVSEGANNKATVQDIVKAVQIVKAVGGAAQTTTLDTGVDITNMSFAIGASETWTFEAHLQIGCNNTGGVKFAVVVPTAATFRAHMLGMSSGVTGVTVSLVATSGTLSAAFNTVNSQSGWVRIFFTVINSTTPGDVKLQFASTTAGQTSTVHPDSFFTANRIA